MWKKGSTASWTVSFRMRAGDPMLTACQKVIRCVTIAPLGRPVVPEVYISMAIAPSGTGTSSSGRSGSSGAAVIGRNAAPRSRARSRASASCWVSATTMSGSASAVM